MREILFRGFYEYKNGKETTYINGKEIKGKWVYGDLVKCMTDNGECIGIKDTIYEVNTNRCNLIPNIVIPETVGQFTGKTVKTGKAFEGDIGKSIDGLFLVRWSEEKSAFVMNFYDYPYEELYLEEMWEDSEIIGNIHDNPELLEVEK